MLNALLSTARRRQLGACGALLAVSVLAACDKNEPTSPALNPTTPSASLGGQKKWIPQNELDTLLARASNLTVEDSARIQKKWLPANEVDTLLGGAARR